jgi:hypothetical protein
MYIHDIFRVYTWYILCIYIEHSRYNVYQQYIILGIYIEYVVNIHGLSLVYYAYILHQVADVEKEGRVPFHQLSPAMTSPGRVITFILLHSFAHLGFLVLCMCTRRARLELKTAGKCCA